MDHAIIDILEVLYGVAIFRAKSHQMPAKKLPSPTTIRYLMYGPTIAGQESLPAD